MNDYPIVSPQGKTALEPVIFSRIVDWRKAAKRGEVDDDGRDRMGRRIAEYNRQVRA